MIQKAIVRDVPETADTFLDPYIGYTVFIIDEMDLIINETVHKKYVNKDNSNVFEIVETYK